MEFDKMVNTLRSIDIFNNFDSNSLQFLASNLTLKKIPCSTLIFSAGDKGDSMYILIDGKVSIHHNEHVFATLGRGQIMGEYALIDGGTRSTSATALTDVLCFELSADKLESVLNAKPALWKLMLVPLVKRLRQFNQLEEQYSRK
ncbi:MAG: cyclic nucleotide-binding domain-containing protein [Salinivirgaceae bacterium]|nr:cyclic nucleotide-binding domain-containing protein [Salinivirgaceae bacterium]